MNGRRSVRFVGAMVLTVVVACGERALPDGTLAKIGDEAVSYSHFERYLTDAFEGDPGQLSSEVLSAMLDQFLVERLLVHAAVERELVSPSAEAQSALRALLEEDGAPDLVEEELRSHYEDHLDRYRLDERVRVDQVLIENEQVAEAVRRALVDGRGVDPVLAAPNEFPGAAVIAVGQEFSRGDLPVDFADAIFSLDPGQASEVLAGDSNFHVFWLSERFEATVLSFEEAEERVRTELSKEVADLRFETLVTEAAERYNVQVAWRSLPFDYVGRRFAPNEA